MNKCKAFFLLPIALACSLLMTGCVARRVAWSPDGTHAVVFAGDGLRLMSADGTLSEPVLTNDGIAEWFPDSTRVAIASSTESDGSEVRLATLSGGKLNLGTVFFKTNASVGDLRVSPDGDALALSIATKNPDQIQLMVAPVDGSALPQIVANNTAACADWTQDGKSLVYVRALGAPSNNDDLLLGSVSRRAVFDAAGKLAVQTNVEDLAGLLFDQNNKVRCLKDGRIIFAAADIHLPCTAADMPETGQLYELDQERQAAIVPLVPRSMQDSLPGKADYFEPSPDGKRIAISGEKGSVAVLTLATGSILGIQTAGADNAITVPTWRTADELCYVISATNGSPAQLVLWNNGTNHVLSASWPAEARKGFLDK